MQCSPSPVPARKIAVNNISDQALIEKDGKQESEPAAREEKKEGKQMISSMLDQLGCLQEQLRLFESNLEGKPEVPEIKKEMVGSIIGDSVQKLKREA